MHIAEQVRNFITRELARDCGAVQDHESLLDSGVLDSIGVLSLVSFIEQRYRIAVNEDEMMPENFDSIEAIAGFIARRQELERV
jgi:acyl carrier protein